MRANIGGWVMLKVRASLTPILSVVLESAARLWIYRTTQMVRSQLRQFPGLCLKVSLPSLKCPNFVYARLPSLKQSGREDNYILPPCLIIPSALVKSSDSMNLTTRTANVVRPHLSNLPLPSLRLACLGRSRPIETTRTEA